MDTGVLQPPVSKGEIKEGIYMNMIIKEGIYIYEYDQTNPHPRKHQTILTRYFLEPLFFPTIPQSGLLLRLCSCTEAVCHVVYEEICHLLAYSTSCAVVHSIDDSEPGAGVAGVQHET